MSLSVQRSGFTRVPEMYYAIIQDLLANGFTLNFPTTELLAPVAGAVYPSFKATLQAGAAVDPLATDQPWCIQFEAKASQVGNIYVATPIQLPDDGSVANLGAEVGQLPAGMVNATISPVPTTAAGAFIFRSDRVLDQAVAEAYPFSYRLTISDHGIVLVVWEDASDNKGTKHSWICVQRPVDRLTGAPLIVGHCPLFCVFGLVGDPWKFVVREADVLKPTIPVPADKDTEDSHAILNSANQVSITENNRYVIAFPNGLNTPRYMYTENLDMIAYCSADVVSAYTDVPILAFGEPTARIYAAMQANAPFNTGMRLLMLKQGGGVA